METREKRQKLSHFVRFAHFNLGDGAATVASTSDGERFYYGVALCNPSDNFSRKVGRDIALKRLFDAQGGPLCGQLEANGASVSDLHQAALIQTLHREMGYLSYTDEPTWYTDQNLIISYRKRGSSKENTNV